jgi:DNA helicase-2/ATP-dependent DNA helicase PcrA
VGNSHPTRPSRFLKEIPVRFLQNASPTSSITRETSSAEVAGFSIGEKVYHQQFGMGIIEKAAESSFGLTYEVYFPDTDTTRTLAAKFAKLSPYEE